MKHSRNETFSFISEDRFTHITYSVSDAFSDCRFPYLQCLDMLDSPFKFFLHPSQVHWCFSCEIIFTFGCRFVGQIQVLFSYNLFLSIFLRVSVSFDDALATSSSLHTDFQNRSNNSIQFSLVLCLIPLLIKLALLMLFLQYDFAYL